MRFPEFLRVTVLISAAAATLLALLTIAGADGNDHPLIVAVGAGWWAVAAVLGSWIGRRSQASEQIASLLASARTQASLPEVHPARVVLNRLWPLVLATVGAGAAAFALPQVSAVACGFAIIWALGWRRQSAAVTAIEERDGARFYIERTSPFRPIRLVRTPGFRSNLYERNGTLHHARQSRS